MAERAEGEQALDELQILIRTGLAKSGSPEEWKGEVTAAIAKAEAHAEEFGCLDVLRLATLSSEYYDSSGRPELGLERLEKVMQVSPTTAESNAAAARHRPNSMKRLLIERFHGLPECGDLKLDQEKRMVRQMCWALMLYAWLRYVKPRLYEQARKELQEIRKFIEIALIGGPDSKWPSFGTMSRWHYFHGITLRGLGGEHLAAAEDAFLKSQEAAGNRLTHRLERVERSDKDPAAKQAERDYVGRFCQICVSRILNALGRLAMVGGHLTRSRQLLAAAHALVTGTGQEVMKLRIEARTAKAARRLADPRNYAETQGRLNALDLCASRYHAFGDIPGELGCMLEVARGHLDVVRYGEQPQGIRRLSLSLADRHLTDASSLAGDLEGRERSFWQYFICLLRVKYCIVAAGDSEGADRDFERQLLEQARGWMTEIRRAEVTWIGGRSRLAEVGAMEGLLLLRSGEFTACAAILNRALNEGGGPLVRADCHLLLAECHVAARTHRDKAETHLREYAVAAASAENGYLRCAEERVRRKLETWRKDFTIPSDGGNLQWEFWEPQLKMWLLETARARFESPPTLEQISLLIGQSPSTLSRWSGELRGRQPAKVKE